MGLEVDLRSIGLAVRFPVPPTKQAARRIPMQSDIFNCQQQQQQQASKGERERKRRARTHTALCQTGKAFRTGLRPLQEALFSSLLSLFGLPTFAFILLVCEWMSVCVCDCGACAMATLQWGGQCNSLLTTTGNGQRATDNGQIGIRANGIGQTLSPISEHLTRPRTTVKSVAH